ncbi:GDSL/SGNH-like acyl-esterase family found in Pmr5 and Cas1p-domain-containing protein [Mrakia frigida]|uniref:GDSL/SGNH-like acyl-esterase family found in Pmr5 and Cas1p-domain-containing protein n=1 Tax=Mrakia frigida TaxID=29902 RepID=UPI003FCC1FEC
MARISRVGLACVAAVGILLFLLLPTSTLDLFITTSSSTSSPPLPATSLEPPPLPLSPPTIGRWTLPSPSSSFNSISSRYGLRTPGKCFVPPSLGIDRSEAEHIKLEEERFNEVGKWEWTPSSGRPLRGWDVQEVVGRMINSPRGMVLVGDSLTQQQHSSLLLLLNSHATAPPLLITQTFHHAPKNGTSLSLSRLNPSHPLVPLLRSTNPFVPLERWSEPIVSFYRHDLLLSEPELRDLLEREGVVAKGEEWEEKMDSAREDFWSCWKKGEQEGWEGMQRDIVVLNSGAHWSERTLGVKQQLIPKAFRAMVNLLLPKFLSLPNTLLLVRSTSTPQLNCETYPSPGPPTPLTEEDPHPSWGWGTFGELDGIWEEALREEGGSKGWMNVTEMSWLRPDAHSNKILSATSRDCLHWCVPIVPHWWNRGMWDLLGSLEAEVGRDS